MYYFSDEELLAQRHSLATLAEYLEEIGWQQSFADLSEDQILTLVSITIGATQDALIDIRLSQRPIEPEVPFPMLDYNHTKTFAESLNEAIDRSLKNENAATPRRDYLGGSRVGHACERALQFEYAGAPKDEGEDFSGKTLRIFAIGHVLEDLAITWLRAAGVELFTRKGNNPDGEQFGFKVANDRIRGHVDGIIHSAPEFMKLGVPALWECKTMNAKNWRACVKDGVTASKPVYAAQIALYQAYMDASVPGLATNPALFTAINKDTAELHHELVPFNADLAQRMSDRAVRILSATDAGELLPRLTRDPDHFECRMCAYAKRCWSMNP